MNCSEVVERLPALLEGELSPEAEQAVRLHLSACMACREEEHALVGAWDVLGDWEDLEPSADLTERIMARVRLDEAVVVPLGRPRWQGALHRWGRRVAALAATFLLVCGLSLTMTGPGGRDGGALDDMLASWDGGSDVVLIDRMPQYVASGVEGLVVPSILYEPADPRHRGTEDDFLEEIIADQNG